MYEILTESTNCHRWVDFCSLVRHRFVAIVSDLNCPRFKDLLTQIDPVFLTLDFSSKLPGADPILTTVRFFCLLPLNQPS